MSENSILPYVGVNPQRLQRDELAKQVRLAKKGDDSAFNKILGHKHSYICYIMKEFFIQGSESQDVYQECAIKLINIIEKYDKSKGTFDAFANDSIRKHIITEINRQKANKRKVLNNSYSLDDETTNDNGESITFIETITENLESSSHIKDSFVEIVQKDHEEYLVKSITAVLSDMESKIFILRYMEHYSYKEISKELDLYKIDRRLKVKILDQKAVDNAIWRSKPKIKNILEKLGLNPNEFIGRFKKTPPLVGGDEPSPVSKSKKNTTWPMNVEKVKS